MTGHLGRLSTRDGMDQVGEQIGGQASAGHGVLGRRPILASSDRHRMRRPLSMAGMALAYLALVAILSIAPYWHQGVPFWHQGVTPHQGQPMACTDFGGSR